MPSMVDIPSDPKKIRARLRSYERKLAEEKRRFGGYDDSAGKRYFIAPLYVLLGDQDGALKSFAWYEREFPGDIGDSGHYLCWALALLRSGDEEKAKAKLRCAMLANRYVLPKLLGLDVAEAGIVDEPCEFPAHFVEDVPDAYYPLWSEEEKAWAAEQFMSAEWVQLRRRVFEIEALLESEPRGPSRIALMKELSALGK